MKKILCLIGVVVGLQRTGFAFDPSYVQSVASWERLRSAARPDRMVVLFFTASQGSCRDCEMMKQKFYSSREFTSWVDQFALMGEVDVSIGRTDFQDGRETYSMITGEVGELVKVARMQSLPSIALYGSDGKLYDWASANSDPENVARAFHKVYQKQVSNVPLPELPKSSDSAPAAQATVAPALKLKMISGTPQRRVASINNEPFLAGETHRISVGGGKLSVQCLEIREKSALVKVEGEAKPWELLLGESRVPKQLPIHSDHQDAPQTGSPLQNALVEFSKVKSTTPTEDRIYLAIGMTILILYFPFCWSCRQLCRRAGYPSEFLVWLPGWKRLALFRAAGVSWWWFFLGLFIPIVGFWGWILCCGRLCETFHQTKWWLLLMIWPVIGWPVFLYLAWSSRADDDEPAIRGLDRRYQHT